MHAPPPRAPPQPLPEFSVEDRDDIRLDAEELLESGVAMDDESAHLLATNAARHRKQKRAAGR